MSYGRERHGSKDNEGLNWGVRTTMRYCREIKSVRSGDYEVIGEHREGLTIEGSLSGMVGAYAGSSDLGVNGK